MGNTRPLPFFVVPGSSVTTPATACEGDSFALKSICCHSSGNTSDLIRQPVMYANNHRPQRVGQIREYCPDL
jgi:hypothetical protein